MKHHYTQVIKKIFTQDFWVLLHVSTFNRHLITICQYRHGVSGIHFATRINSFFKYVYDGKLTYGGKHKTGHDLHGHHNTYAKGSRLHSRNVIAVKQLFEYKFFVYLGWFCKKASTRKIFVTCVTPHGRVFYLPLTTAYEPLTLAPRENFEWLSGLSGFDTKVKFRLWEVIKEIKNFTYVCWVAVNQYSLCTLARACGSRILLMSYRRVLSKHLITARLPSGKLKYININVVALYGQILPTPAYLFKNTKAGYWRNLGQRPHVRGTAMNPVDHPHGGRCKAVRKPRTPWGLPAK